MVNETAKIAGLQSKRIELPSAYVTSRLLVLQLTKIEFIEREVGMLIKLVHKTEKKNYSTKLNSNFSRQSSSVFLQPKEVFWFQI